MARRLVLLSVIVMSLGAHAWLGRSQVDAQPRPTGPTTLPACKSDLARTNKELAAAREEVARARAAEAAARAEADKLREAERQRQKRLEQQTGIAADRLR